MINFKSMAGNNTNIRSFDTKGIEISWFAPTCDGDDQFLGKRDPKYRSSWENAARILLEADKQGFRNILCPSSYQVGQDTWTFAAAAAPQTKQINLLPAIRCGEYHPPILGRSIATLDHILKGRLTLNIISSNLPGEELDSESRYQRSREVIEILKQGWTQDEIDFKGDFYEYKLNTAPVKPYQNDGPLLYFGGYAPAGVDLCAQHCDVYLMWPDREEKLAEHIGNLQMKASNYDRKIDFGLRVHVIVREKESEAQEAARNLMSYLDQEMAADLKHRAQDSKSYGVSLQNDLRAASDKEGYAEAHLWTGIGQARSGCGAALVGDPDQILNKIQRYHEMGIRSLILSGYPHLDECQNFGRLVLPELETISLPDIQGKIPVNTPNTPLGTGPRR
jgi:alkanesulfonate monooxygenase